MIRLGGLRILVLIAISVALIAIPQSAFAQRGGHAGSGGFHGSGAFHGGGNFGGFHAGAGGFHGSGYGAFHSGGYYGFHGHGFYGYHGHSYYGFGYPAYGFGFGFGPYWGYPYYYGYGPWWNPYAYYYPYGSYYYPPDYPDGRDDPRNDPGQRNNHDGCDYRDEDNHPCKSNNPNAPPKPSSSVPESSPEHNYVTTNPAANDSAFSLADYRPSAPTDSAAVTASVGTSRQLDSTASQLPSGLRPAVRNVIQALRAMPPDARQRQLNSGRYHNLSPQELEFVINATQPPQALTTR